MLTSSFPKRGLAVRLINPLVLIAVTMVLIALLRVRLESFSYTVGVALLHSRAEVYPQSISGRGGTNRHHGTSLNVRVTRRN